MPAARADRRWAAAPHRRRGAARRRARRRRPLPTPVAPPRSSLSTPCSSVSFHRSDRASSGRSQRVAAGRQGWSFPSEPVRSSLLASLAFRDRRCLVRPRAVEPGEGAGEDWPILGLRLFPRRGWSEGAKCRPKPFGDRRQPVRERAVGRREPRVVRGGALEPGAVQPLERPAGPHRATGSRSPVRRRPHLRPRRPCRSGPCLRPRQPRRRSGAVRRGTPSPPAAGGPPPSPGSRCGRDNRGPVRMR